MDLQAFLMCSPVFCEKFHAAEFAQNWSPKLVRRGDPIVEQGAEATKEIILLQGCAVSRIYDADGRDICVGLYVGPCVVTPNIARARDHISLVSIEGLSDTLVAQMDSVKLTKQMLASEPVRDWANSVLRNELGQKADREWCLAALGGSDRLAWFRDRYPGYEDIFVHSLIASFLGITPVTLSRLRQAAGRK